MTGREVELAIARSNAATNQLYFLNLNSAGRLAVGQTIFVGPDGQIIHQAGVGREIITVEMDFTHVQRVRERGLHGLCQTLKSFRDHIWQNALVGQGLSNQYILGP